MWPSHQKAAKPAEPKWSDNGNAATQYNLGGVYEVGLGVQKDLGKAAQFYQKAADQGFADAQVSLGRLYEKGEGVPKDLDKARELYQKAANQGNGLGIKNLKKLQGR